MIKKQMEHLVMVSLKYFFDLDYTFYHHALLMILVVAGIVKIYFTNLRRLLYDGIATVKADLMTIKAGYQAFREKWNGNDTGEVMM